MISNFAASTERFCSVNRAILKPQQREHKEFIGSQARREEYFLMTWCVDGKSQPEHSLQGVGDGGKLKLLGSLDLPHVRVFSCQQAVKLNQTLPTAT